VGHLVVMPLHKDAMVVADVVLSVKPVNLYAGKLVAKLATTIVYLAAVSDGINFNSSHLLKNELKCFEIFDQ